MYSGLLDFFVGLSRSHSSLFALTVIATIASAGLALHGLYSLFFRFLGSLLRPRV